MKRATAYLKDNKIYLHASSRTSNGVWILTNPVIVVDFCEANLVIAKKLIELLLYSKLDVAHPDDWSGLFNPVLKLSKTNSWSNFIENATSVEVDCEGNSLELFPTVNLGKKGGFEALDDLAVQISESKPELIGETLKNLLIKYS